MAKKKAAKDEMANEAISAQLKTAINESGLSLYRIAKEVGIGQPILARFVSGERDIRLATADKIAAFFGMKLSAPKPRKE